MENGYEVKTTIFGDGKILQTIEKAAFGTKTEVLRNVLDTMDAQLRQGLIDLGWTPPPEASPAAEPSA